MDDGKRLYGVDLFKALSMLLVVALHINTVGGALANRFLWRQCRDKRNGQAIPCMVRRNAVKRQFSGSVSTLDTGPPR